MLQRVYKSLGPVFSAINGPSPQSSLTQRWWGRPRVGLGCLRRGPRTSMTGSLSGYKVKMTLMLEIHEMRRVRGNLERAILVVIKSNVHAFLLGWHG